MVADTDILSQREDYEAFLVEMNLTHEDMHRAKAAMPAPVPHPKYAPVNVVVETSHIDGMGAFAARDFETGALIAPVKVSGGWTRAGRYTNHSPTPNMVVMKINGTMYFVARQPISRGEELTVNYRQVRHAVFAEASSHE